MPASQRTQSVQRRPSCGPDATEVTGRAAARRVPTATDAEVFKAFALGQELVGDSVRSVGRDGPGATNGILVLYSHEVPIALMYRRGARRSVSVDRSPVLGAGRCVCRLAQHVRVAANAAVDADATLVQSLDHDTFMAHLTAWDWPAGRAEGPSC